MSEREVKRWSIAQGYLRRDAKLSDGRSFEDTVDSPLWVFVDADDYDKLEAELTKLRAERDRMQVELNRWRELAVHHERESAEWERRAIVAEGQAAQLLRKAQSKRSNQRDRFIVPAPSHESPTISSPEMGVAHRKQEDKHA